MIIEVEPRENIAAGTVRLGTRPVGAGRERAPGQRSAAQRRERPAWRARSGLADTGLDGGPADGGRVDAAGILAAAAGRSLVAVVRDAHRDEQTRSLVSALLAARPDLILVEMGLPFWHPPEGTSYLATYGASRASAHAAAELLGLTPA